MRTTFRARSSVAVRCRHPDGQRTPPPPHTHTTFVPFLWRRRKLASHHGEKGEVAIKNKRSRGIFMGRAMKPSSHADLQVEVNDTDREGEKERERKIGSVGARRPRGVLHKFKRKKKKKNTRGRKLVKCGRRRSVTVNGLRAQRVLACSGSACK